MKINDIFKDEESENLLEKWLEFREEELSRMDENDQKHLINFDDYCKKILKNTTNEGYNYVSKQLEFMHDDFIDYCSHWNDKYYMTGFSDAVKLIIKSLIIK